MMLQCNFSSQLYHVIGISFSESQNLARRLSYYDFTGKIIRYAVGHSNLILRQLQYKHQGCLHGGRGPQIGKVTCVGSPHLSCKGDQIKMRDYMDRQITPRKQVTSPNCPPPPCKQALRFVSFNVLLVLSPAQHITHIFIHSSGPSLNLFMFVELATVNHQGDQVQNRNFFYY